MADNEVSGDQPCVDLGEADETKPEVMSVPLRDLSHLEDVSDSTLEIDSERELGFEDRSGPEAT